MDYRAFVADRQAGWSEAARVLDGLDAAAMRRLDFDALEALVARHRALAADLGVVQDRWPGSAAEATLRHLVLTGHGAITPPNPSLVRRAAGFLLDEYPGVFRASLPSLRLSGLVFLGAAWLGFVLCTFDEDLAALSIGPEALDTLRRGEIWTDALEERSAALLAVQILVNNIAVALFAWAGGLTWGLGTTLALVRNGVMVGAMVAVTLRHSVADRLVAFVPAHGLLELFLIIVAGAAGYELARGALGGSPVVGLGADGTLGARFAASGAHSFRLVAGTVPWFVLLGLVEGFLSPRMGFPTEAKLVVGGLLLGLFLLYTRIPPRSP